MFSRLHEITESLLEQWECRLIEINGEEELLTAALRSHVHILFQYHPAMELSKFVNNFKSVTSRKLRQEFPSEIKKFYTERCILEQFIFYCILWRSNYFYPEKIY